MKQELLGKLVAIFRKCPVITLCTAAGNTPYGRTMVATTHDDLSMTTATFLNSRKVSQIRENPLVCLVSSMDSELPNRPYGIVQAVATVHTDTETKRACWVQSLDVFFSGPEDPNYAVIRLKPVRAEYWTFEHHEPNVLEFDQ